MSAPATKRTNKLNREVFTISRELEYFNADELTKQTGYGREEWWPGVIAKEGFDNALDAAEQAGVAPEISVYFDGSRLEIRDNGKGIPPEVVARLTDFSTRTSDKLAYVSPTRGAQGNAWKTLLAMPYVLDGANARAIIIEARGVRHELHVRADQIERRPRVDHYQTEVPVQKDGTRVVFERFQASLEDSSENTQNVPKLVSDFALFNPHASFSFNKKKFKAPHPDFRKWMPTDATPAGWYSYERFVEFAASMLATGRNITVRDFLANFRGLARTQVRAAILAEANMQRGASLAELADRSRGEINEAALNRLWHAMQRQSADIKPEALGVLSKQHFQEKLAAAVKDDQSFRYAKQAGTVDGMPFVVEAAFRYQPKDELLRGLHVGLNWSVPLSNPFKETPFHLGGGDRAYGLTHLLAHNRVDISSDPIAVVLHVAMPRFEFVDRGKGGVTVSPELAAAICGVVLNVTKKWAAVKKARDREHRGEARRLEEALRKVRTKRVTIIDAAWQVMVEAYKKASGEGRYPAHARQIMYAARPAILEITGKDALDDEYFTQDLLPRYIRENPEETAKWDVVYDERGHLSEPHTGLRIGLGTLSVREYLQDSDTASRAPLPAIDAPQLSYDIETSGPHNRYGAILFIEKEGFLPLFERAQIAERYDLAIMSSKGMGSTASRQLLERLAQNARIFVLHDFDKSGFSILGTLTRDTDRYQFTQPPEIIDLGLRLEDVENFQLQSEPVDHEKTDPTWNLRENGASDEEVEFLAGEADYAGHYHNGRRVELNALASDQLLELLEAGLKRHGVSKVIPDNRTIAEAWRRVIAIRELNKRINEGLPECIELSKSAEVPKDLASLLKEEIGVSPALAWDEAVRIIAERPASKPTPGAATCKKPRNVPKR